MRSPRLAIALAALLMAGAASAQWKWKDASGRIQYSDLPPPASVAEKDILQRPAAALRPAVAPASAAASAPQPLVVGGKAPETELDAKRRKAEEEEAAKAAAQKKAEEQKLAAAKADNCSRARGQLKLLDEGVRVARTTASGEREILDDAQRAAETRRVREIIASDCR